MTATARNRRVSASLTSVVLANQDAGRQGLRIQNLSTAVLFLTVGGGTTEESVRMPANAYYEEPFPGLKITGRWASVNGWAVVTEIP